MDGTDVSCLDIRGLSKRFGGVKAMRDLDLAVGIGERLSVIGTNGAGKSTLFNLIAGAVAPTTGTIRLFGDDVTRLSTARRARRGLARTFQTSQLFDRLTVAENVFVALGGNEFSGASIRRSSLKTVRWEKVERLLERVGLADRRGSFVGDLSHGEQRQLEIAMAMGLNPRILMLDEPAAGFSPGERTQLVGLLRELPSEITLLLIEHDMDIALAVANRVVVMHDGAKILEGTPSEIRNSDRVREIYLGGSIDSVA